MKPATADRLWVGVRVIEIASGHPGFVEWFDATSAIVRSGWWPDAPRRTPLGELRMGTLSPRELALRPVCLACRGSGGVSRPCRRCGEEGIEP